MKEIALTYTFNPLTMNDDHIQGMDRYAKWVRLNGSHVGNVRTQNVLLDWLSNAINSRDDAILYDFQGFKIRVEEPVAPVSVKRGARIELVKEIPDGNGLNCLKPDYSPFLEYLVPGTRVVLDDGNIVMHVTGPGRYGILCEVTESAIPVINARKGIDAPDVDFEECPTPEKDLRELDNLDRRKWRRIAAVAWSYAQRPRDVEMLKQRAPSWVKVKAKPENKCGVANVSGIARSCDCIVVPRGDLFVTYGLRLPAIESEMIVTSLNAKCEVEIATGLFASFQSQDRLSQSDLTALWKFMKMGVSGFWVVETAVSRDPVTLCRKVREAVDGLAELL